MALQVKDLSVLAYANGFTLWHYITDDPVTDLDTAGYFDEATDMLRPGDLIMSNYRDAGEVKTAFVAIKSTDGGVGTDAYDVSLIPATNID